MLLPNLCKGTGSVLSLRRTTEEVVVVLLVLVAVAVAAVDANTVPVPPFCPSCPSCPFSCRCRWRDVNDGDRGRDSGRVERIGRIGRVVVGAVPVPVPVCDWGCGCGCGCGSLAREDAEADEDDEEEAEADEQPPPILLPVADVVAFDLLLMLVVAPVLSIVILACYGC